MPRAVERWISIGRLLRWLDALIAWLVLWGVAKIALPAADNATRAVVATVVVVLGALIGPIRVRWRPVAGAVALVLSARLAPGDHAWYVRSGAAERVLVTGRHPTRIVIVRLNDESAEGLSVRRTRVLLVRGERDRG
jgi:hypothetical protein